MNYRLCHDNRTTWTAEQDARIVAEYATAPSLEDLAKQLGTTRSYLINRASDLRVEGHEIPKRRTTKPSRTGRRKKRHADHRPCPNCTQPMNYKSKLCQACTNEVREATPRSTGVKAVCRHCKLNRWLKSRGLCFSCRDKPAIADLYAPDSRYASWPPPTNQGRPPPTPCRHAPGSEGRIATLTERAAAGYALFHPDDLGEVRLSHAEELAIIGESAGEMRRERSCIPAAERRMLPPPKNLKRIR